MTWIDKGIYAGSIHHDALCLAPKSRFEVVVLDIPSIVCLGILTFGLFRPVGFLLAVSWALAAFGSLAVIPTELTGGASLTASTVGAAFIVVKVLMTPGSVVAITRAASDVRQLGLLALFTIEAVVGAIILPLVFQDAVVVFPLRFSANTLVEPLSQTSANFTQSAYLFISFLIAASYGRLVHHSHFLDDFGLAILIGAFFSVLTGLTDITTSSIGLGDVLSIFRTASYAFLTSGDIQGVRRTIGLMPEASAYGALVSFYFSLLLFTRHCYSFYVKVWIVTPLLAACGVLSVLSTSSSAYAMLCVTLCLLILNNVSGVIFGLPHEKVRNLRELVIVLVTLILLLFGAMFFDQTRETLFSVIDLMVLHKSESASFIERSSWTRVALEAWVATDGLGVGVGSVRASNFFANILASTGFLGFFLFALFLIKTFLSYPPKKNRRMVDLVRGSKLTLISCLVGAALAGTTPDYGATIAALFGIIAGAGAYSVNHSTQSFSTNKKHMLPSDRARFDQLPT